MATLYEYYNTGDDSFVELYGIYWRAQTFTPSVSHTVTSVKAKLQRWNASGVPGTVTVSIRATDGATPSKPIGSDLCNGTTDGNTLTTVTGGEWREITLGAGTLLTAGIIYAIVIRATSGAPLNSILWRVHAIAPSYPDGNSANSNDSGVTWTPVSYDSDYMFEEWGDPSMSVRTDPATNVEFTSATLNGTLLDDGDDTPVTCSFQYGLTTSYGSTTSGQTVTEGNSFSSNIAGLVPNTLYHFRAKAVGNSSEIVYGADRTFRTKSLGNTGYITRIIREYGAGVYRSTLYIGGDFNRNVPSRYAGLKERKD